MRFIRWFAFGLALSWLTATNAAIVTEIRGCLRGNTITLNEGPQRTFTITADYPTGPCCLAVISNNPDILDFLGKMTGGCNRELEVLAKLIGSLGLDSFGQLFLSVEFMPRRI